MHEQLGDAQVQRDDARDRPEWHSERPLQHTGLAERREQPSCGVPIGAQQILARLARLCGQAAPRRSWRATAQDAREHPVTGHDVAHQVADVPVRAGGGISPLPVSHRGNQLPGDIDGLSELACRISRHGCSLYLAGCHTTRPRA